MSGTVSADREAGQRAGRQSGLLAGLARAEVLLALAAFAVLCVAVLSAAPQLVEPGDHAYRASIVAPPAGPAPAGWRPRGQAGKAARWAGHQPSLTPSAPGTTAVR